MVTGNSMEYEGMLVDCDLTNCRSKRAIAVIYVLV
jgi:hypothetical protein